MRSNAWVTPHMDFPRDSGVVAQFMNPTESPTSSDTPSTTHGSWFSPATNASSMDSNASDASAAASPDRPTMSLTKSETRSSVERSRSTRDDAA